MLQERTRPNADAATGARLHPPFGMTAGQARDTAHHWVQANAPRWPGLRAAHLVGGITAMTDEAPFPADKDVDLHLIFAAESPILADPPHGMPILEALSEGVAIEAGLKSIVEYRSAGAVLGNPEIAHHLTVDSILHDPDGLLHELQATVRQEYPQRRWVLARLEHERRGLAGALAMLPAMRARWGGSGEVNILGYTTTFATAALWVAALQPPKGGGRVLLRLREILAVHGRLDLHEELLAALGLANIDRQGVAHFLAEAAEGFDLAVELREASSAPAGDFAPFQHKLHRHLRPYFVGACRDMLDRGHHREAMGWVLPYHLATADVITTTGPDTLKPLFAARQDALLQALGLDTAPSREAAVARLSALYERIFALAEGIVDGRG